MKDNMKSILSALLRLLDMHEELEHNWNGLLIEPTPDAFKMLTKKVVVVLLSYIAIGICFLIC